jgi:hypothetical protein
VIRLIADPLIGGRRLSVGRNVPGSGQGRRRSVISALRAGG